MTTRLTTRNFAKIAETTNEFEECLKFISDMDAQNVLASQMRHDYFGRTLDPAEKTLRRCRPTELKVKPLGDYATAGIEIY
jgi:hypothetical protein